MTQPRPEPRLQPHVESSAEPEVLNADEAAALLRVSLTTVLKESRQGLIPGVKVGREWRYSRTALLRHLARYSDPEPADHPDSTSNQTDDGEVDGADGGGEDPTGAAAPAR